MSNTDFNEDIRDGIQEVTNVAVGEAADKIARSFSTFVNIPIPSVHLLDAVDVSMALSAIEQNERVTAVTQPFFGSGISGEALLIFTDASMSELSQLMGYQSMVGDDHQQVEHVLEMASLLNGSCIHGICAQLDISVLLKHPTLLGQHRALSDILRHSDFPWDQTLAIELNYAFEDYSITCDLIILFHEGSLASLFRQVNFLLD
ncbi:MAG: histidine kinase [Oceanicoccus sp.]|uniref:histidine kinase n=1 Tax=Oceanicoccus sp. TaxID=2691044 RepID=UPI002617ADE4|nr:histidine kinase [Oceanicoccus sp.]MCP3909010.1 histidine kinase [Oceanicoccus sp.]MDG1771974.1 histidine kinase [Oceanicoccus sp.]